MSPLRQPIRSGCRPASPPAGIVASFSLQPAVIGPVRSRRMSSGSLGQVLEERTAQELIHARRTLRSGRSEGRGRQHAIDITQNCLRLIQPEAVVLGARAPGRKAACKDAARS